MYQASLLSFVVPVLPAEGLPIAFARTPVPWSTTSLIASVIKNAVSSDIIFSVGYMKVIEKSIIENFDVINLHPSILPTYKGLMTQKRMLINNEKNFGFSLHKVSKELDEGETISNKIRKINTKDESELLYKHKNLEHEFVYKQFVDYLLS